MAIERTRRGDPSRRRAGWLAAVLLGWLLAGSVGLGTAPAHAAPKLTRAQKKEARTLFFSGMKAFKAGDYLSALTHFIASYKIRPKAVVVFNIAMCHRALFRYNRSIIAFRSYEKLAGNKMRRGRRAKIRKYVQEMSAKLGRITLRITRAGAKVRVDGEHAGTWPNVGVINVDPGSRKLEVTLVGHRPFVKNLLVREGQRITITVKLQKLQRWGFVVIATPVVGALGSVDGGDLRRLPLSLKLSEGPHRVRLTAPGHKPREMQVTVVAGQLTKQEVLLEPLPRPRRRLLPLVRRRPPPPLLPRPRPRPRPRPFYKKAWFWTVMGAVVVGASATAGYFIWDSSQPQDRFDERHVLR